MKLKFFEVATGKDVTDICLAEGYDQEMADQSAGWAFVLIGARGWFRKQHMVFHPATMTPAQRREMLIRKEAMEGLDFIPPKAETPVQFIIDRLGADLASASAFGHEDAEQLRKAIEFMKTLLKE